MITRDLHVHLYGCLTANDLWEIGKDIYNQRSQILDWYASEYEKAWSYRPDYRKYWESDSGIERLTSDYLFENSNHFSRFQANFNLIIALCPVSTEQFTIQEKVIRNASSQGLEYFEPRTLIPLSLQSHQIETYLHGLCSLIQELNLELKMETKLVFSLFRDNQLATKHYTFLRDFIKAYPRLGAQITGIDFAFAEEGFPPKDKQAFFKKFHQDNLDFKPLDLLYHVGESFADKGIDSAIRWIWEAQESGASRLGHAIALGVHPENYKNQVVLEPASERLDTITWLLELEGELADNGFCIDQDELKREAQAISDQPTERVRIVYDDAYIERSHQLQIAVASLLREKAVRIESCPTSNLRIGQVSKLEFHPLAFFHKHSLNYHICTDDPGIFNINWASEDTLAQKIIAGKF